MTFTKLFSAGISQLVTEFYLFIYSLEHLVSAHCTIYLAKFEENGKTLLIKITKSNGNNPDLENI